MARDWDEREGAATRGGMMARNWNERDHPRDGEGKFRDRTGGGWAQRISDTVGRLRGERQPVPSGTPGRHIAVSRLLDDADHYIDTHEVYDDALGEWGVIDDIYESDKYGTDLVVNIMTRGSGGRSFTVDMHESVQIRPRF